MVCGKANVFAGKSVNSRKSSLSVKQRDDEHAWRVKRSRGETERDDLRETERKRDRAQIRVRDALAPRPVQYVVFDSSAYTRRRKTMALAEYTGRVCIPVS